MSKILLYIYDDMADSEISLLVHVLIRDLNKEVVVISESLDIIKSASKMVYKPEVTINEIMNEAIDGIIIPGGWLKKLSSELVDLLQRLNQNHKFIAAICAAPWILAESGVLTDKKYTTSIVEWTNEQKNNFGIDDPFDRVNYIEKRTVRDGNIITAKGIAFIDFTAEVCDYLGAFKDSQEKLEFTSQF